MNSINEQMKLQESLHLRAVKDVARVNKGALSRNLTKPLFIGLVTFLLAGCATSSIDNQATSLAASAEGTLLGKAVLESAYRDIRPEHWRWWGADYNKVDGVMRTIRASGTGDSTWDSGNDDAPGNWTYEFSVLADSVAEKAEKAEATGDLDAAASYYDEASVYYGLAKYPHTFPTPAEDTALLRQLETYQKSFELDGYGYERVEATLDGRLITGFLHLPKTKNSAPWPIVIGTAGLDVFLAESGPLVRDLLDRGIAVLMSDIPGTGVNNDLTLSPEFDRLWPAFVDALASDSRIDSDNAGAFGISFAGNAVAKLAMTEPDSFRAIANICGPIHSVFTITARQLNQIKPMYLNGLIDRLDLEDPDPVSILQAARPFSLKNQGLVGDGQTTTVPVMSLNARGDNIAPVSDMELMTNASEGGVMVISGADDHCPKNRARDMPKVAEFFEQYLR